MPRLTISVIDSIKRLTTVSKFKPIIQFVLIKYCIFKVKLATQQNSNCTLTIKTIPSKDPHQDGNQNWNLQCYQHKLQALGMPN